MFQVTAFNKHGVCVKFVVDSLTTKRNQLILRGAYHTLVINHTSDSNQILLYERQATRFVNCGLVFLA